MQEKLEAFAAANTTVLGISKYGADETSRWLRDNDWTFPILVDGAATIRDYGIPNPDHGGTDREGIPHPATIIVGPDGIVRFVNVWVNYRERTTPDEILERIARLPS